jgi:hypothetical protein
MMTTPGGTSEDLSRILDSAKRLGVEMDESEALQWLAAIAASKSEVDIEVDAGSGVYGHKITMLDFSPAELAYFRQVGNIIEFHDEPGVVETALSLSGSAAQSKIQTYPGDCDYFERVNIIAPTRPEANEILARIMREKALSTAKGPTFKLLEVKFGSYPVDLVRDRVTKKKGTPISWSISEIEAREISGFALDGSAIKFTWDDVKSDPGWCKLDWVVADPVRGRVAYASNMLDVTWESPDGEITPLDGYLDPYFQEVYLQAESIPLFSKLVKHVAADALEHYVGQLEHEVEKYLKKDPRNYGKVAKRMYNIFRLTGRYNEAAFLRELFDEPATILYQIGSLIESLEDASTPGTEIDTASLLPQADKLILAAVKSLEGEEELRIVKTLLQLRDSIARHDTSQLEAEDLQYVQTVVINEVNKFFYERLAAIPSILEYMREMAGDL